MFPGLLAVEASGDQYLHFGTSLIDFTSYSV